MNHDFLAIKQRKGANTMLKLMEAIPFSVFLLYIRLVDTSKSWEPPFVLSGLVAIGVTSLCLYKKQMLHRLFLGINLYLISGGLAFVTHQHWLNQIYNELQASGMLLWIILVGIVSTVMSPRGFIGAKSPSRDLIKKYSLYLLLISVLGFVLSWSSRGNRLVSEIIPFASLFLIQSTLKAKIEKAN